MNLEGKKIRNIFRLVFIFLVFSMLPVYSLEVIQPSYDENQIDHNRKIFEKNIEDNKYSGELYIPNPIDLYKEKKSQSESVPAKKTPSKMTLDCEKMEYNHETGELNALGKVILKSYPEKTKITADKAVYDRETNIIKLFDNVSLYKDNGIVKGDYMVINLNEENILINEPVGEFMTFRITGREGYAYANQLETINGNIELAQKIEATLASYGFGTYYDEDIVPSKLVDFEMRKKRSEPYRLKTKEIIIKSEKDHDNITLKGTDIYYKKFKLASVSNLEITTDKNQNYVETNMPELGSIGDFGTYIGPGFVFKTPGSSTLKVIPIVGYGDGNFGIGAVVRHRSKRNWVEGAYSTATKNLVVRGKYSLNDRFKIEYARHGYVDDGIFGHNRPGYLMQLTYEDGWHIADLNATFKQRISGGYVSEYLEHHQEDHNNGTMRLRWMGELSKNIFEIGNREQEMFIRTDAVAQAAASVYGTGDTLGLFRLGPSISSRVKAWGSRIYFTVGGVHGHSPYVFDDYRYGKVSITIDENLRLGKYFALGYRGTFSPLKDNYEKKMITENKFYFMLGPEDVKVALSWDSVREIAAFDIIFLVGSDNAKIKYDKLTIQDPSQIGKERKLFEDWKYRKVRVPEAL